MTGTDCKQVRDKNMNPLSSENGLRAKSLLLSGRLTPDCAWLMPPACSHSTCKNMPNKLAEYRCLRHMFEENQTKGKKVTPGESAWLTRTTQDPQTQNSGHFSSFNPLNRPTPWLLTKAEDTFRPAFYEISKRNSKARGQGEKQPPGWWDGHCFKNWLLTSPVESLERQNSRSEPSWTGKGEQ